MTVCGFGNACKMTLFAVLVFFLFSCSPVKKLAKEYVLFQDTIPVLILEPEVLIKNDLRFQARNIVLTDSLMLSESKVLKDINDTLVHYLVFENLKDELKASNFRLLDSADVAGALSEKSEVYVIKCVQIELDEYDTPLQESQQFDTTMYFEDFLLNTVSVNIWFEVSMLNDTNDFKSLLFYNNSVCDEIDGRFRKSLLGNEIKYIYKRADIDVNDVYNLAAWFGLKNASNFYDYFMNQYIYQNYNGKPSKYKYIHYDKKSGKYSAAKRARFVFINYSQP